MDIPKSAIKIYTHYENEFGKTIVTVVHLSETDCNVDSLLIKGNITKNIIIVCDNYFINFAIQYGGFYLDDKFIPIEEIETIHGKGEI